MGFALKADPSAPHGFDVEASVPSRKQLGRVLRDLDNAALQFLLDSTVQLIAGQIPPEVSFGDEISLDTKHIVAWVAENNPKAYLKEATGSTKTASPGATGTANSAAKRNAIPAPKPSMNPLRLMVLPLHPPEKDARPTSPNWMSIIGAMLPVLSPPKSPVMANLSWPNSPKPSTGPISVTSFR